jgi:hypothetical protein
MKTYVLVIDHVQYNNNHHHKVDNGKIWNKLMFRSLQRADKFTNITITYGRQIPTIV